MRILISGSTGLIGRRLVEELQREGHAVVRLVRRSSPAPEDKVVWSPETGRIESGSLDGLDAVIHLAGEGIASGRWTSERKKRIRDSRVVGTRHLAEALAKLPSPPRVLVSSSAIGYYGDRGDVLLDESQPPGADFLAEVCQAWEAAAQPAALAGIRVAQLRTGLVLDGKGGALARIKIPFLLGVGGRLGDGRQYMSWISLDDVVGAFLHILKTPSLSGPVNGVAPSPVTNAEFTASLGRSLHRPTIFPLPKFAGRLLMGEMAEALLFSSQRVTPQRLLASGYRFRHPDLDSALRAAFVSSS